MSEERTYEMLWDCSHCGTKKNLGLTHRHCPNCGSPQPAEARYFPSEADKVAVEDHAFVGKDKKCAYCQVLSARAASHCGGCGAPLDQGTDAQVKAEQVGPLGHGQAPPIGGNPLPAGSAAIQSPAPSAVKPLRSASSGRKKWMGIGCGLIALAAIAAVLALMFLKKDGVVDVVGHNWTRDVQIEQLQAVEESAWCDQTPPNVSIARRTREVRSHRDVPDGQDCRTVRTDRGDGTFTEQQRCTPRTRQEPVQGDKCYYRVNRWRVERTASATGASLADAPHWPEVQIQPSGSCVGCRRQGAREAHYRVRFREQGATEESTCDFDEARWRSFAVGSSWNAQLSAVTDALDCDSLRP